MPSLNTKLATAPNVSANYVLKATTSTTIGNSLIFDNGTNVGIGNTNTSFTFDVTGTGNFSSTLTATIFDSTSNAYRLNGNNALSLVTLNSQSVVKINAAGFWGVQLVGANDQGILINNIGNIGVRNTNPFAGATSLSGLAISDRGGLFKLSVNDVMYLSNNLYYDGTNWKRIVAGGGTFMQLESTDGGTLRVFAAATGTAGSNATTIDRFMINSSGNVGIGTGSPFNFGAGHRTLDIRGDGPTSIGALFVGNSDRTAVLGFYINPNATGTVGTSSSHALQLVTSDAERMRITSGGIIYALNNGVDGTYQPMIGGMYASNNNETNLISTAVSSAATQSGFRFDVSNGAGSAGRTTSMTINRSSVTIVGSLSKGSGSFKIEHPLESKKDTHHLVHSFVESPQANNIYRGKVQLVDGKAEVNLDEVSTMTEGTFVLLNREIHTYTSNETDWYAVRGNVIGNILHIECQNEESNAIVSWLVIGERQDKHMMDTEWTDENGKVIVEPLKQIITTEQQ